METLHGRDPAFQAAAPAAPLFPLFTNLHADPPAAPSRAGTGRALYIVTFDEPQLHCAKWARVLDTLAAACAFARELIDEGRQGVAIHCRRAAGGGLERVEFASQADDAPTAGRPAPSLGSTHGPAVASQHPPADSREIHSSATMRLLPGGEA